MKKILSLAVAFVMVMALTVSVFANLDLTSNASGTLNENLSFDIPAEVDVSDGATVTLHLKGTSDNTTVRAYLTDAGDVGRVTDVAYYEVTGGAFDATVDILIDYEGGFGGTTAPTRIMLKGQDSSTPLANTTFEVIEIVNTDGAAAPAETWTGCATDSSPPCSSAPPSPTSAWSPSWRTFWP